MTHFRLDRLATLYFFHPLSKIISSKDIRIPILMYHSISEDKEDNVHPYYRTVTTPKVFAEHMKFLYENSYRVISLSEAVAVLENSKPVAESSIQLLNNLTNQPTNHSTTQVNQLTNQPVNYVVITFDDGFCDFYTNAFPILQNYGFTATVFLPTGFIDNRQKKFKERECLIWNEVKELRKAGITFGSHTVTHPQLKLLKRDAVEYELIKSKETIEEKFGEMIDLFSYPYKFPEEDKGFTRFLADTLERYGYKYGVSTRIGTATVKDNRYFLKRIPVNSCDDLSLFKAKLEGGYDWLHGPQYYFKLMKRKFGRS